jgi:hypothetical protein
MSYIYDNIIDGNYKDVTLSKVYNVCHSFHNFIINDLPQIMDDF